MDVFFVLSGFLITGLVAREIVGQGRFSFRDFYARRVRRLLPAALVCLLVTVGAAALLLPPLSVRDIAGDGAAAALYVSNIRFALEQTDYFFQQLDPSPLLHYWSLGVEEQFYLIWPLLLVLAARLVGLPGIAIAIGVIGTASLLLSVWLTGVLQPWAFYSLPSRAWQLSLGGLLAIAAMRGYALPGQLRSISAIGGLVVLVVSFVVIGPSIAYPGTAAVLPATGAALVIAAGVGPGLAPGTGRTLHCRRARASLPSHLFGGSAASPTRCTSGTGRCWSCRPWCSARSSARTSASWRWRRSWSSPASPGD